MHLSSLVPRFLGQRRAKHQQSARRQRRRNFFETLEPRQMMTNVPPVAIDDDYTQLHDQTMYEWVGNNDSDANGDPLTYELVGGPAAGDLTFDSGSFSYTPLEHFTGDVQFTYQVSDGVATDQATVRLSFYNDAPVAADDEFTQLHDQWFSGWLSDNDSDPNGDGLTYELVSPPAEGEFEFVGSYFAYTPVLNSMADVEFTYQVSDGIATDQATVRLSYYNDAPIAGDDEFTQLHGQWFSGWLSDNDGDPNGDGLTYELVSAPAGGEFEFLGSYFSYTPPQSFVGDLEFIYQVSDGVAVDQATVRMTFYNNPPIAEHDSYTFDEDSCFTDTVLYNDWDPDGETTFTASLVTGVSHGELTLNADGTFIYTPNANYHGEDSFTYRLSDGVSLSNIALVNLVTQPVNDPPVASLWSDIHLNQDEYPSILSLSDLFSDFDHPSAELTLEIVGNSNSGLIEAGVTVAGDLEYALIPDQYGSATLTLMATDPEGASATQDLTFFVNGAPYATPPFTTLVIDDTDPASTALSIYDLFADAEEPDVALNYDIANIDNFDLFEEVSFDSQTGNLTLDYASGVSGTSNIMLVATDAYGASGLFTFAVSMLQGQTPTPTTPVVSVEFIPFADLLDKIGIAAADQSRYGELDEDSNPNANIADPNPMAPANAGNQNLTGRFAWVENNFMGGDRFFPDATATASTIGRNVVRVRANLSGAVVGDAVWFRSFDVDDPSDVNHAINQTTIDPNDTKVTKKGNDNRGRLEATDIHSPAASVAPDKAGASVVGSGRLRSVGAANAFGAWGDNGRSVKAIVKPLTNAAGQMLDSAANVVTDVADAQLIAEVDLATTFAPGDNFRVAALYQKTAVTDAIIEEALNMKVDPHSMPSNGNAPLIQSTVKLTGQLAIWRRLWIEDDASTPTFNIGVLMQAGTTNRQDNRFADAFLEPTYVPVALNTTPLAPTAVDVNLRTGKLSQNGDDQIWLARDSRALESSVSWVSYIGNTFTCLTNEGRLSGFTVNDTSDVSSVPGAKENAFEASIVLAGNLAALGFAPATIPEAQQKIAVHEIAHQITGDNKQHRGDQFDMERYLGMTNIVKAKPGVREKINIMNEEAALIPMNNPNNLPAIGPYDLYYFHAVDIALMRLRTKSPGKG